MKVVTMVGTRPEVIKLCRVIAELDSCVSHRLIHTGQNYDYELNEIFFQELDVRRPDVFLNTSSSDLGESIGNIIATSYACFIEEKPDALLLLGDTNSCLSAIPAKRLKIPIFHMEAGNRCFDERVPEEVNRRIVDHISDINLTYTEHARRYLLREGLRPEMVIKTGSPMREVLDYYSEKITKSSALQRLHLREDAYFLISVHREENVDDPERLTRVLATLHAIAEKYGLPVIVSTHPRTRLRLDALDIRIDYDQVRFLPAMGFFDYVKLQCDAFCVLSDSGTLTEESSILRFPAITLRDAHERPEGMDETAILMSDLVAHRVIRAIEVVRRHHENDATMRPVQDYSADNVSQKIVRILVSYTDYVNRVVWRREVD